MMVMLSTGMGFGELRHVRRRDVNMKRKCIVVRDGAKVRTFPLNGAARKSMTRILDRWKELGGCDPNHFILPRRSRREGACDSRENDSLDLRRADADYLQGLSAEFGKRLTCRTSTSMTVVFRPLQKFSAIEMAQGQHLSGQSDEDRSQQATGNLIGFPLRGGAAFGFVGVRND